MIHGAALVGAAVCFFALVLAISPTMAQWEMRLGLLAAAIAGLVWLYRLDAQREEREKKRSIEGNEARFRELARLAEQTRFNLTVKGSSFFSIGLTMSIIGGLMLLLGVFTAGDWILTFGGLLLLCFGIAGTVLRGFPGRGKPVIVLSAAGFTTPLIPLMPWAAVDGISMQKLRSKGEVVAHILSFRIDALPQLIHRTGLLYRLMYPLRWGAGKKAIGLPLRKTSEHPEVVFRVARLLWTKATGRDHDWEPMLSEEANLALRQSAELSVRLQNRELVADLIARDPAELQRLSEAMHASGEVVMKDLRRKTRLAYWISGVTVLVFVLYLCLRFIG